MQILDDGWDSRATLVDDVWLERTPRRPEVAPRLLLETRLLPWLAEQLPLPVPQPEVVWSAPLRIRHRLLAGHRSASLTQHQAHVLGRFLRVLHGVEVAQAVRAGVPPPRAAVREQTRTRARFAAEVLPRLPPREREIGAALLGRTAQRAPSVSLVHGDLGPAHVLSEYGELTGVIDWSDAHIGDPALDLAWPLFGSGAGDAVAEAYGAGEELVARALDWHRLGPWHEVLYGVDTDQPQLVVSGMRGVRARLAAG